MPPLNQNPNNSLKTLQQNEERVLNVMFLRNDRSELQKYYQVSLEKVKPLFDKYAIQNGIDPKIVPIFEFTNDPDITTAAFMVSNNGNNPQIKIGLEFFVKNKIDADQAVWVLMHEMTHLIDYVKHKKEFMEQFENSKKLGHEMASKLAEYYKQRQIEENKKIEKKNEENKKNGKPELDLREVKEISAVRLRLLADYLSKMYSSCYYNAINDIFVNNNVSTMPEYSRHTQQYNSKSKDAKIKALYRDILFRKNRDVSEGIFYKGYYDTPEFKQFMDFLLRGDQLRDEGMRITEGVQEALSKEYSIEYQRYEIRRGFNVKVKKQLNTQDVISIFCDPNKLDVLDGDIKSAPLVQNTFSKLPKKDTSLKYRSEYLDATLLPTFSELLFKDMQKWIDNYIESGIDNDDDAMDKMFEEFEKWLKDIIDKIESESPDFIPDEVIKQYSGWKESEDAKNQKPKPDQYNSKNSVSDQPKQNKKEKTKEEIEKEKKDQAKKARKDMVDNFAKKNNIDPDVARRVAEAYEDTHIEIEELFEVWRRIILRTENEMIREYSDMAHREGERFDQNAFVRSLPNIVEGNYDGISIFNKLNRVDNPSDRPERIEVSVVADQSYSMDNSKIKTNNFGSPVIIGEGSRSDKNKIVDRVLTMLNMSLAGLNKLLVENRQQTRSKLHVDTECIIFGNTAKKVFDFRYEDMGIEAVADTLGSSDKTIEGYKSLESVGVGMGGTYDDVALDMVLDCLSEDKIEKIKNGKVLKIVFEITDGGSSAPEEAKKRIEKLAQNGVLVFAFQIGKVNSEEAEIFDSVWNSSVDKISGEKVKRGFAIGENFKDLPKVVAKMLENYIGNVKIYD